MAKKTIILTQKQLDEICGGDSTYLDGLALNPDKSKNYANLVTSDGAVEYGYPDPTRTDQYAADSTNDWRGNAKLHGMGPITVREMSKKEFEDIIMENQPHGNARLNNSSFGESERSYNAATTAKYERNKAIEMSHSQNPMIRQKGLNTLRNMDQSGIKELETAQQVDKNIQNARPEGEKIVSAPKQSGNGKAHTPKNGIIH